MNSNSALRPKSKSAKRQKRQREAAKLRKQNNEQPASASTSADPYELEQQRIRKSDIYGLSLTEEENEHKIQRLEAQTDHYLFSRRVMIMEDHLKLAIEDVLYETKLDEIRIRGEADDYTTEWLVEEILLLRLQRWTLKNELQLMPIEDFEDAEEIKAWLDLKLNNWRDGSISHWVSLWRAKYNGHFTGAGSKYEDTVRAQEFDIATADD